LVILARIEVDVETLARSGAGLVYGKLVLRIDGVEFPHPAWTDFAVVVLGWWCDAAVQLFQGDPGPIDVRFMEGPFLVELQSAPRHCWHLVLIEDDVSRRIRYSADVDAASLGRSLLFASERILEVCQIRGWWSPDADHLMSASAEVRRHINAATH